VSRDHSLVGSFTLAGHRYVATVDGTSWRVGRADNAESGFSYEGKAGNRRKAVRDACRKLESAHAVYDLTGSNVTPIRWHGEGAPS
jgi:hypothetical protein